MAGAGTSKWVLGKGNHDFRAVATPGFEPIVADELGELGVEVTGQDTGGVLFRATLLQAMTVNLLAATPERIWVRAADFTAKGFGELVHKTRRLDWSRVIREGGAVQVVAACHQSRLMHTGRVKEAIEKVLAGAGDDQAQPVQRILARIVEDRCTLSVDMSGDRLHMRGYREEGASAPIRETRAAALLRWVGWAPGMAVHDPCCGSGTFLIEAARAAAGICPGADRSFAFESWPKYDAAGFRRARTEAGQVAPVETSISGTESARHAATAALSNATRARVGIDLTSGRFQDVPIVGAPGVMIANPPYGKRLGTDLMKTWEDLGCLFAASSQWRRVVLSPNPTLYAAFRRGFKGPEPSAAVEFLHGGTRIRALQWPAVDPSPTSL
jgi:putative N6-adenine-specific DNA methylase